jgi:hypothetical protein
LFPIVLDDTFLISDWNVAISDLFWSICWLSSLPFSFNWAMFISLLWIFFVLSVILSSSSSTSDSSPLILFSWSSNSDWGSSSLLCRCSNNSSYSSFLFFCSSNSDWCSSNVSSCYSFFSWIFSPRFSICLWDPL